jgi:AcrR family transcriptional regulator
MPKNPAVRPAEEIPDGWQRRRERLSLHIERVALELFARSSPEDVTIDQIASAAGISTRTFFRYFATRDEVLAALPRRNLERYSSIVRERPGNESILEAFKAAELAVEVTPVTRELVLLYGIVQERSPVAVTRALAHSSVDTVTLYRQLVAERTGESATSIRVGAIAAALVGVTRFAFAHWLQVGARVPLASIIVEALGGLEHLQDAPPVGAPAVPSAGRRRAPASKQSSAAGTTGRRVVTSGPGPTGARTTAGADRATGPARTRTRRG